MRIYTIPQNRIALFSRNNEGLLRDVENRGNVKLEISKDGEIKISGVGGEEWIAEQVLIALSYGFKPRQAFKLFGDDYFIELINLDEACHHSEKLVKRCLSRVIGTDGKAKKRLEELSEAFISVQDNVVAILGEFENLRMAKEAVFRITEGAEHSSVYAYLEGQRRKQKERELLNE